MTPPFIESDRGIATLGTHGGSRIISMLVFVDGGDAVDLP